MKIIDAIGISLIVIGVMMTVLSFFTVTGPRDEESHVLIRGSHYYLAPPERPL